MGTYPRRILSPGVVAVLPSECQVSLSKLTNGWSHWLTYTPRSLVVHIIGFEARRSRTRVRSQNTNFAKFVKKKKLAKGVSRWLEAGDPWSWWSLILVIPDPWWSLILVISDPGDPWSLVIPDPGDPWSWWSPILVIPDPGDPWSWWSLVLVIPDPGDPRSWWSLILGTVF